MRFLNDPIIIAGAGNAIQASNSIDCSFVINASVQVVTGAGATGTIKLQASNDAPAPYNLQSSITTPTNWTDIASATASVTAGSTALIPKTDICYQWLRAVFTPTSAGVQTIQPRADVAGNLNSKYFLLNSGNNTHLYYVWFNVNSAGVDPMIAGRTGVPVAVSTGDSAATIGGLMATAIAGLASSADFTATGTTTVTVTNLVTGPFAPAVDGNSGFTFTLTTPTGTVSASLKTIGF